MEVIASSGEYEVHYELFNCYQRPIMRLNKRLNSLFIYAIEVVLSLPLIAIIAMVLFQKTSVQLALVGIIYSLAISGSIAADAIENYFHFSLPPFLQLLIWWSPAFLWVALGFSFYKKKKKWMIFIALAILEYALYGALYLLIALYEMQSYK